MRVLLAGLAGYFSVALASASAQELKDKPYFTLRGNLDNCRLQFERELHGRVAFLGGSITHNPGWRDQLCEFLQSEFPETEFDFINAGIPSMGSTPGAFRLYRDVLSVGRVDLLWVEAAVNDSTNGRTRLEQTRAMEGIVRHARREQPRMDIVFAYFADPQKLTTYAQAKTPDVIRNHEIVAQYYRISALNLAWEVRHRIDQGEFSWEKDFVDLHPSPFGQALYFRSMRQMLRQAWREPLHLSQTDEPHLLPEIPLDPFCYDRGRLKSVESATLAEGWSMHRNWQPQDRAGTRRGFVNVPVLEAGIPGKELEWRFTGRGVGLFVLAGPDAGVLEYSIDGAAYQSVNVKTRWSEALHLPFCYVLAPDLNSGDHRLHLRMKESQANVGKAVRIAAFLVNSSDKSANKK